MSKFVFFFLDCALCLLVVLYAKTTLECLILKGTSLYLIYPHIQESFARRCFTLIDEYAPGFSTSVIGYDMLTPPDLEREIGLTGNKAIPSV